MTEPEIEVPVDNTSERFRVFVFARPDDPETLTAVLMSTLKLNRIDARIHAHAAPGLLPDRLSQEVAVTLVTKIRELGLNAITLPESSVPKLDHPDIVHRAACLATGFEVAGLAGSRRAFIAWHDVELISLGWMALESVRHFNVESQTVVFSAPHSTDEKLDVVSVYGAEVLILTRNPDHVYRLDQDHMNYEYLGDRMADSATTNFREFFKDLTSYAQSAYLTPSSHAFLTHTVVDRMRFKDSQALRDETLLHVVLHREQQRLRK